MEANSEGILKSELEQCSRNGAGMLLKRANQCMWKVDRGEEFSGNCHIQSMNCVFVGFSCHNKMLQSEWLKQQTFIFHNLETLSPRLRSSKIGFQ